MLIRVALNSAAGTRLPTVEVSGLKYQFELLNMSVVEQPQLNYTGGFWRRSITLIKPGFDLKADAGTVGKRECSPEWGIQL